MLFILSGRIATAFRAAFYLLSFAWTDSAVKSGLGHAPRWRPTVAIQHGRTKAAVVSFSPARREDFKMNPDAFSRRRILGAAVLAAPAVALPALPAEAYQGNMERALSALEAALQSLQAATPNKGGHRERAMRLIEHAMGEVQAGIDFAYAHGGGGY
jgi:hypothetical protein